MFNFCEKNLLMIRKISNLNFVFVLTSFLILEYGFINSEFSLNLIANNSHTTKPMIYKISGLWGNPKYFTPCMISISFFFSSGFMQFQDLSGNIINDFLKNNLKEEIIYDKLNSEFMKSFV